MLLSDHTLYRFTYTHVDDLTSISWCQMFHRTLAPRPSNMLPEVEAVSVRL